LEIIKLGLTMNSGKGYQQLVINLYSHALDISTTKNGQLLLRAWN